MDIAKIINQAKDIILKPKDALQRYKDETITKQDVLIYLGIVAFPTFLGIVLGYGLVGVSYGWGLGFTLPLQWAFAWGIMQYIMMVIGVVVFAYVFNMLAPSFSSKPNKMQAIKLVMYATTPVLVAGILNIWPVLSLVILLVALYSLYILYVGLPIYMETPNDKRVGYLIVSIIIYIVIVFAISWIVSTVMWNIVGYNPYIPTNYNYPSGWPY